MLVHGAWHGSWCWKRVRNRLHQLGHEVFTPTLTGLADRSHLLAPTIDLETHILDVANLISWEELTDVVLCGHSYAGAVIAAVADRLPDRVRALVYLDAFVPSDGEDLSRYVPADLIDGWFVRPIPAERFQVNADDREWVDRQCTPQSIACWQLPVRLAGGFTDASKITYVSAVGEDGSGGRFLAQYERAKERGWATRTINCGHDVMLDAPDALIDVLVDVVRSKTEPMSS